ncbi:unnamed protein product [Oikopleura dioica]|uniref:Kinetochore protein NDC80 n=1 Tax=Oikopleura dioica TaxID=34765 RepID=E4Y988_OIKDI|nr:unnamed protein product [Oikopleura dioica]
MDGHRRLTSIRRSEFPGSQGRQPRDSITADGYRLSIAGGQSTAKRPRTHASNDPRDLIKKPKQKEFCEKLQNFLLNEINFREVTVKELSTMTTGMFHEIFSALVRNILGPNYLSSLGKMKVPEMIVETMQALNYPIKLVKSSFVNLTKQTFPTALGVLDWLSDLIVLQKAADNAAFQDNFDLDEVLPIFEGYARFANKEGTMEEISDAVADEVAQSKQEQLALEDVDIDGAYRRLDEAQLEVKDFKNAKRGCEKDLIDLARTIEDSTKFVKMSQYKLEKGAKEVKALQEQEARQKEQLEQIKRDNKELREKIGDEETAIDKRNRLNALVEEDQKWKEIVVAQRSDLGIIEVKISRAKANNGEILIDYNTTANSLRELSDKFKIPFSIAPNNIEMLEEKRNFISEADQLCHKQISKISSENDVLNFENDDIEKQINAEKDDHDLISMNFQSKFQKSKGELKKIEEENAHLKNRIAKGREAVMNICEDIEALQSDKIELERKLEEVKEEANDNFGQEEENCLIEFIDAADKKKKTAKAQNQTVKDLFEREMAAVKTRITRAEEMHQLIKKSDLNSNS